MSEAGRGPTRSFVVLAIGIVALLAPNANGQGISDKTLSLPRQALPRPAVGASVVEPVFGTTITRLTDRTNSGGYATQVYSQLQAFSPDNAYVILVEDDDTVVRRTGDRSLVGGLAAVVWNAPRWQPTAVRTIVHYDGNADTTLRVQYTTVDPVATSTIFTFPVLYERVMPNQSFDELSRDGRWMAGAATLSNGDANIFALDLQNLSLGAEISIAGLYAGPCPRDPQWGEVDPDWIGMSPLGNYLMVQWARDGTDRCSGLESFDPVTGAFVGRVYDGHQHGDLGVLSDGATEFFMTFEISSPANPSQPAIGYRVLPGTATVAAPVYLTSLAWGGGHISCQGPDGVCLVSYGEWPSDGWTPFEKEEFLQFTDGSVLRLAHHRSSECGYWVQPRGSLSRDGSRAIFASDWADEGGGNGCGDSSLGEGEAYVITVPNLVGTCGDGQVTWGEDCDGSSDAACPGLCQSDCTCPAPLCGNGIVESGETCDGSADTNCPGACLGDCSCPVVTCPNGTCDAGETASSCPADCGCAANGACGQEAPSGCYCDAQCGNEGDCCPDVCAACGNGCGPTPTPAPTPTPEATGGPTPTPSATAGAGEFCRTPGLAIPDGSGSVEDVLTLSGGTSIIDIDVRIEISHEWVGDLSVWLRHESTGTERRLLARPGYPAAGYGCGEPDVEAWFDDEGVWAAENECQSPAPAIAGDVLPLDALGAFDGEGADGAWNVRVEDSESEYSGTLDRWCLRLSTSGGPPSTPGPTPTPSSGGNCGNGILEGAEQCDAGAENGGPRSCCASDCSFKPDGSTSCDGSPCTQGDVCTSGVCTPGSCSVGLACGLCGTTCTMINGSCRCG